MKNKSGFTIVEVLVASAVGLVVAVTQHVVSVQKQVRSITADLATTQFVADLTKTLKKGDNCNEAMKGQGIDDTKPISMMGSAQFNSSSIGKLIRDANTYDPIIRVADFSLELQSVSTTSNARDYNLYLTIEKKREMSVGPATVKRKLGLLTLNVAAGVIADPLACLGFDGAAMSPLSFGELPVLPYTGDMS